MKRHPLRNLAKQGLKMHGGAQPIERVTKGETQNMLRDLEREKRRNRDRTPIKLSSTYSGRI